MKNRTKTNSSNQIRWVILLLSIAVILPTVCLLYFMTQAAENDRLAMGQYLRPGKDSLDVVEYFEPEKFDWWKAKAKEMGFKWVMASPFTRSSYHAEQTETE